ncbi:CaiB/BaiF CoA transferase family protein [Cupriavidus metallidurans]|uniref:CaiB/BaiF CoA transferase family protein n=1 Tax=Cupriavidus metallidurans TaxID=119219 RepID=UPI001CCFBC21|nr:CoA transferase [Cupriavidus metallidurans]UBM08481.1 CoA transferase [Cupriavidus metallidurans]
MKRLLTGIRVIDFTWVGAGSFTTKLLADLGADVIKIETAARLDSLRIARPFKDRISGVNRSGYFADRNSSKRSITVNAKYEEGLGIVRRLIADADLVTNNFTPGVMEKMGLGYDSVREIRPDVVYASMSMQGITGPEKDYLGYGLIIGALTGVQHLTGLPDREPAGTGTNYPDHIPNPTHAAFAILAALRHRRRTGQGQFIDIAQTEPTLALLGPWLLNASLNGVIDERRGNTNPDMAPHGVYPCAGNDRWLAIAVANDAQWLALCEVLGIVPRDGWARTQDRLSDREAIDPEIAARTKDRDGRELVAALQAAGVSAGAVNDAGDVLRNDPQLQARGHWVQLNHPEMGPSIYNAPPFRFSDAESTPSAPAPLLGQHTREICEDLLGLDDGEVDRLIQAGVLA